MVENLPTVLKFSDASLNPRHRQSLWRMLSLARVPQVASPWGGKESPIPPPPPFPPSPSPSPLTPVLVPPPFLPPTGVLSTLAQTISSLLLYRKKPKLFEGFPSSKSKSSGNRVSPVLNGNFRQVCVLGPK